MDFLLIALLCTSWALLGVPVIFFGVLYAGLKRGRDGFQLSYIEEATFFTGITAIMLIVIAPVAFVIYSIGYFWVNIGSQIAVKSINPRQSGLAVALLVFSLSGFVTLLYLVMEHGTPESMIAAVIVATCMMIGNIAMQLFFVSRIQLER